MRHCHCFLSFVLFSFSAIYIVSLCHDTQDTLCVGGSPELEIWQQYQNWHMVEKHVLVSKYVAVQDVRPGQHAAADTDGLCVPAAL
jgi:hypothetical protein